MTRHVVILGGGPAGVNLALALMQPGFSTTIIEPDPDAADRAAFFLARLSGAEGPIPSVSPDPTALAQADVVFDAQGDGIPDLPNKTLLIHVDPAGTQSLSIRIYAPIHLRRLVEIYPGPQTPTNVTNAVCDLIHGINRVPVVVTANPSIGTRLTRRLYETADHLLLHGAIPHELDEAMVAMGCDMGVYQAQDLIGLDVAYADRKHYAAGHDPARPHVLISDRMVEEGRLGKKVGVGWYRYPGGGGAVIDPLIEDLVREEARFARINPQIFTESDLQARLFRALTDESTAMLADGTAAHARDIARVLHHGLGFPTPPRT